MSDFMSDDELRACQEAKRKRRVELEETIKKAGLNPAEIDITMVMSDEEQARVVKQMAERNEARKVAEQFGRQGLRDRLRKTIETSKKTSGPLKVEDSPPAS